MKNLEMNFIGDPNVIKNLVVGESKVTLLLPGGGQGCIYQAGVLKFLEENQLQRNIKAVYGNSGGTIMGWNLLGNGVAKNVSCMYQEHVEEKFVNWRRGRKSLIDTSGLANRMMTTRGIDFSFFKNSEAELYSGTTHFQTGKHTFHKVPKTTHEQALPYVLASFAIPYIGKLRVWIDGERETDGAFSDPLPAEHLHSQSENLLIILTKPLSPTTHLPASIGELFPPYLKAVINHSRKYNEGVEYLTQKTAHPESGIGVIFPQLKISPSCINPAILMKAEMIAYDFTKQLVRV